MHTPAAGLQVRSVPVLLATAAFATSVGGGRILSAAKGLTGLTILGSGSLLALVCGSALSLAVLRVARRTPPPRATLAVSVLSGFLSVALLLTYTLFGQSSQPSAAGNAPALHGTMGWLFFVLLVIRSSFSFAGRSLRSGLASSISRPLLSLTEAMYFAGLMFGLMIGRLLPGGAALPAAAFGLDLALQITGAACDFGVLRMHRLKGREDRVPAVGATRTAANPPATRFWYLTAAYSVAAVACQIVAFMIADTLARRPAASARALADSVLAAFYLGIASAALLASTGKLQLARTARGHPSISLSSRRVEFAAPVAALCCLSSALTVLAILVLAPASSRYAAGGSIPAPANLFALTALAASSAAFGVLVLAVMSRIARDGPAMVALALAAASAAATGSMVLLLASSAGPVTWTAVNVLGFLLAWGLLHRVDDG